jgi:hypothetical protein
VNKVNLAQKLVLIHEHVLFFEPTATRNPEGIVYDVFTARDRRENLINGLRDLGAGRRENGPRRYRP